MAKKKRKATRPLVTESKYEGKYVAFGTSGKKVVASGGDVGKVIQKARNQGIDVPAIVFVPKRNVSCIY